MPGEKYRSIKNPRVYEALRRQGMSKERAAAISNSQASRKRRQRIIYLSRHGNPDQKRRAKLYLRMSK